jgi:YaiO family outer membrane protein
MTKKVIVVTLLLIFIFSKADAAEQVETERLVRQMTPPLAIIKDKIEKKDEWYVDAFYEASNIIQGNRTGHWNEITNRFGYIHQNIHSYIAVSQWERFDDKDYTANIGSYLTFPGQYVHMEVGFGWLVNYIYKIQSIAEYGHRLYENLFWQVGYNYRGYPAGDTHLIYPALLYYFGDSYLSASYGRSIIEGRNGANFGTFKGDFAITKFLHWSAGVAFGERLYDIFVLPSEKEPGYIIFTGLNINVYKGISARIGYSCGAEKPKFYKHSMDFSLSVKF